MFFFVGGVQPKTVTLDDAPRLCPACGLAQARLKRVDHYLSLFFIPLFPVKRGEPILVCDRCGSNSSPDEAFKARSTVSAADGNKCPQCGHFLEESFRYCPNCGTRL